MTVMTRHRSSSRTPLAKIIRYAGAMLLALVAAVIIAVLLCGCTATSREDDNATTAEEVEATTAEVASANPSREKQWEDLAAYAEKFRSGKWDGTDDEGYAKVIVDSLCVGDLPSVNLYATTDNTSTEGLIAAYDNYEWDLSCKTSSSNARPEIWSSDYQTHYWVEDTGYISSQYRDEAIQYDIAMIPCKTYDGAADVSRLAEMFRTGEWSGQRVAFEDGTVAMLRLGEISLYVPNADGTRSWWKNTYVYPNVSVEPLNPNQVYHDHTRDITIALAEDGICIYSHNGIVSQTSCAYDPELAIVYSWLGTSPLIQHEHFVYIYDGIDTVYRVNLDTTEVSTHYQNVIEEWVDNEVGFLVVFEADDGTTHLANGQRDFGPAERVTVPCGTSQ